MIDLAALRSLEAVRAHGSVIAVAEALGYTPSAVSQRIQAPRAPVGVAQLEQLETDLHAQAGEVAGDTVVGGFSTGMRGLIGPVTGTLMAAHPRLRIGLHEALGRGELPATLRAVPVRDPVPTREIIALWRRTRRRSPAVRAIVAALKAG